MTTIVLGGVTLNPNMVWAERYFVQSIAQSVKTTLGGAPVVFAVPLRKGQELTLLASENFGWLQKSVVDQLVVLASVPGAIYSLEFGSQTMSVVFAHHNPPALQMTPFVPRIVHEATDYFIGQIKLLTV